MNKKTKIDEWLTSTGSFFVFTATILFDIWCETIEHKRQRPYQSKLQDCRLRVISLRMTVYISSIPKSSIGEKLFSFSDDTYPISSHHIQHHITHRIANGFVYWVKRSGWLSTHNIKYIHQEGVCLPVIILMNCCCCFIYLLEFK